MNETNDFFPFLKAKEKGNKPLFKTFVSVAASHKALGTVRLL